ncbi:MAG: acyltransferase family protein [Acidobacteriaceae bacterium]
MFSESNHMAASPRAEKSDNTNASPAQGGRLSVVQGLRAIAALLVVWTHSIDAAGPYSHSWQGSFLHMAGFGACGLDIFFVISGFIVSLVAARAVAKERHSAGKFLLRRFTRIYPLYWILTIVVVLEAEFGTHPIVWRSVSWLPTVALLPSWSYPARTPILSLGWSLVFEMYFYLVLALWMAIGPRHLVRNTLLTLAAMVGIGALIGFRRPSLIVWSNPILLEFLFGCAIGQVYSRGNSHPSLRRIPAGRWLTATGALGLLMTLVTGYGSIDYEGMVLNGLSSWQRVGLWGVPSALLVLGAVLWSPGMRSFPARLVVFLGDASYSIYLCTTPARSIVKHFWRFFGRWGGDVGILLCGIACILAGVVCYLLVERTLMRSFHNWYKPIPLHPVASGPL